MNKKVWMIAVACGITVVACTTVLLVMQFLSKSNQTKSQTVVKSMTEQAQSNEEISMPVEKTNSDKKPSPSDKSQIPKTLKNTQISENVRMEVLKKSAIIHAKEGEEVSKAAGNSQSFSLLFDSKEAFKLSISSAAELNPGNPYKVSLLSTQDFVAAAKNGNMTDLIKNARFIWEVPVLQTDGPTKPAASMTVDYFKGMWQVVETGGILPSSEIAFSSNFEEIQKVLDQNKLVNPQEFAHIRLPSLGIDYLYVKDLDGREGFIPLESKGRQNLKSTASGKGKTLITVDSAKKEVDSLTSGT